jgi:PAS domain S-box-containing protein
MSKELILFEKDKETITLKFMRLQDLLVKNKSSSQMEFTFFLTVFYIQIITGFFSSNLGILDKENSLSDNFLNLLNKILRIKEFFYSNPENFFLVLLFIFFCLIIITILYLSILLKIKKNSIYSYREKLINLLIKIFLYLTFNPILDLCFSLFCFTEKNPHFKTKNFNFSDDFIIFFLAIIILIYSIFLCFLLNANYHDCKFLFQNSFYSRMNCNYEIYITINNIIYDILLSQINLLGKDLFLIYNIFSSIIFGWFYFTRYIYYDNFANILVGTFHIIYIWSSIYFFVFSLIKFSEIGIIYLVGILLITYLYMNFLVKNKEKLFLNIPFHQIKNRYHILFYLKSLLMKIYNININITDKSDLIGIIENHILECPQKDCLTKNKKTKIYVPSLNEWSDREKNEISDEIFLYNFPIFVINYYLKNNLISPDLLINLSYYYLNVIGNYCKSMMFYNIVKQMRLNFQEKFSLIRLKFLITKSILKNLSPTSEGCSNLKELNVTFYYKYEDISQKFLEEISNDLNLLFEFWKILKNHVESNRTIDFNKVYYLIEKIRLSKNKIEKLWKKLFHIFPGINALFDLYENYIEQINDNNLLLRELNSLKSKNLIVENIQINYYKLLFNPSTGIIIANGDKFKEGIIEKANDEIERIFEYKVNELKGMNVTRMIPKEITKKHQSFMRRYYDIGEKRVLDKQLRTYARDKENCIIPIKLYVKLFPVLADHTFFLGIIQREFTDDLIILDKKFNIQCCSRKLMEIMELNNKLIFQNLEIPFYIVCKNFINFFKNFLKKNNKKTIDVSLINYNDLNEEEKIEREDYEINEDIEVCENTELEYSLTIPNFIHEYNIRNSNIENSFEDNFFEYSKNDTTIDIDRDEKDNFIGKNENKNEKLKEKNDLDETNKVEKSERLLLNNQRDKKIDFMKKIYIYKDLFEFGKFNELQDYIDICNQNSNNIYKFNFSFQVYNYGQSEKLYIVRCINNKNEYDDSKKNNKQNELKEFNFYEKHNKSKENALKNIEKLTDNERKFILEKTPKYLNMCREDNKFIKLQYQEKQEIENYSKLFSNKREIQSNNLIFNDDQGSQASSAGFNDSLSKKSRLIEIRSNIMKNSSGFYTIKWIKLISMLVFLSTIIFSVFYLLMIDEIYKDMTEISNINVILFQSTIRMSNIVSSLLSLRYLLNYNIINYPIKYNSYITDKNLYFETLRNYSLFWGKEIINELGYVEKDIHHYLLSDDIFWTYIDVTYPNIGLKKQDTEMFSFSLMQVLIVNNDLLKNKYFSYKYVNDFYYEFNNNNNINKSSINNFNFNNSFNTITITYSYSY